MTRPRGLLFTRLARRDDRGFAMIMVMGIALVMMIVITAAVSVSISNLQKSRGDQNSAAAESAAYAGVADYESKLANNNTYYLYGNSASTFTPAGSVVPPIVANPAFGLGKDGTAGATWATVPGGDSTAQYRYEVDNSKYTATGIVRLRVTGRVGSAVRSLVVNVKQHGFVDFMYFTQFELQDPLQTNPACVPSYDWQSAHSNLCSEIQFAPSDIIDGPVHSNDTIEVCGSHFTKSFTTSDPVAPHYEDEGCGGQQFDQGTGYLAPINMPPTNSQMKQETRSDLTGSTVPNPGCLYTGPTVITLTGDGNMNVKSPFTKFTNTAVNSSTSVVTGTQQPLKCGTVSTATGGLGSVGGATVPVVNANLVFVQNIPPAGDPNYTASGTYPPNFTCNSTSTVSGWSFGSVAYPRSGEVTPAAAPVNYGCRSGDVYVQGALSGTMTIATDNYTYITGDITYVNNLTDMLGLVGNNAVWVYNPFNSAGNPIFTDQVRKINAAILSLSHTFQVQNYNIGATRGTLSVYGAIAQKYRGTVGSSDGSGNIIHGYSKTYTYDQRLAFQAPPKFLSPVSATYGTSQLVEVASPFNPDGSYR
jgi:Tfp pilus assembly protein PilX